jgi:WD40 repeat protein
MIKPESSSATRKRQATSAPLDEDPLQPASSSQEHDASSVPSMLPNLVAALILPFVQDRSTWNSVCSANKELSEEGKRMRPPWPNTTLNVGGRAVLAVAFSPCKSFLACGSSVQTVLHVWDRHGKQTRLEGHTGGVTCLQYSLDRKYLASGSRDKSIRLWRTIASESVAHSSSSDGSTNRCTKRGTPEAQSDITLLGHAYEISALAFSPTDSNILASGCWTGDVKLWDVINQVCIHAFNPGSFAIKTLFFSPGDNIHCYVVTMGGPMIRIVRNNTEFAATILEPSLGKYPCAAFSPCGTCFAAISYRVSGIKKELSLFDLRSMAKTQSVLLSDHCNFARIAMSPDGKRLATTDTYGGIGLFECHDRTIHKYVDTIEHGSDKAVGLCPVAFDPTSRCFAVGCIDGRVKLRTL